VKVTARDEGRGKRLGSLEAWKVKAKIGLKAHG